MRIEFCTHCRRKIIKTIGIETADLCSIHWLELWQIMQNVFDLYTSGKGIALIGTNWQKKEETDAK